MCNAQTINYLHHNAVIASSTSRFCGHFPRRTKREEEYMRKTNVQIILPFSRKACPIK